MKKIIFLLTITLCSIGLSYGQDTAIKPLKIGDKIPDLVIQHLLGKGGSTHLADLHHDKYLIINFWATWCVPCIRELPRLDSLASTFNDRLNILTVEYENNSAVTGFLKNHPELNTSHLIMATDDKVLIEYFKHIVIPHNVWIDKDGTIKYMTSAEEMTESNVRTFLHGQDLNLHRKIDIASFDLWAPFHLSDSVYIYRSIFTAYIDGIYGGHTAFWVWKHPTERWLNRYFTFNSSKQQILWEAVCRVTSNHDYYNIMRIITPDSTRFFWPSQCPQTFAKSKYKSKLDWEYDNAFCYELTLPKPANDTVFFGYVLNDLERFLNIKVSRKDEKMPVTVLTLKKGFSFKVPANDSTYITLKKNHLSAHNIEIMHLFEVLNEKVKADKNMKSDDPPYVDETGIKSRVDIDIDFGKDRPTYTEIKQLITKKYGIQFRQKVQPYFITIIQDLTP
jgi:thiol-disulfide isomerase/thioredoxin